MNETNQTNLPQIIQKYEEQILTEWIRLQQQAVTRRADLISDAELQEQSRDFLSQLCMAIQTEGLAHINSPSRSSMRDLLTTISVSRAQQGFTPSETATFVFSLKQPLFDKLRQEFANDAESLGRETWAVTLLLDQLGLLTTEIFLKTREAVIARQQQELLELSTPVVQLWEDILALPLIGTLDSERTQVVMENLLQNIVATGSSIAIIDITGVPLVDTLVAQHLLKTVAAARLMGADCIISGIRPQIAQTIVHLGVDLSNVVSKATLADAFLIALQRTNKKVVSASAREEVK